MATHHGRRKKRKSVAVVAFDFGSLGLSSTVAAQAIEKVRDHTQALEATADMNHLEAVAQHEKQILLHEQCLREELSKVGIESQSMDS